jgi:HPt (histidine-containing phosphotransfer) domain-containing protein
MDDYLAKPIKSQELQLALAFHGAARPTALETERGPVAAAAEVCFDYSAALQTADQEMIEIITDIFLENYPADLQKMRLAIASGHLEPVLYISHALKGTVAMFGADPARELAHRIEQQAKRGDPLGLADLIEALATETEHLASALKSLAHPASH